MVLLGRIELPTSPLPRVRSTTELQQRYHISLWPENHCVAARLLLWRALLSSDADTRMLHSLAKTCPARQCIRMTSKPPAPSREERLAAKLRENLRRRKAQARALDSVENTEPVPSENIHHNPAR